MEIPLSSPDVGNTIADSASMSKCVDEMTSRSFTKVSNMLFNCRFAVIDTGAFIRLTRLERIAEKCFITPSVSKEIRDATARQHLQTLIDAPDVITPSDEDVRWARHFARLTGDLGFLSSCDLELIALTYMLHRKHGDSSTLRTSPLPSTRDSSGTASFSWGPSNGAKSLQNSKCGHETLDETEKKDKPSFASDWGQNRSEIDGKFSHGMKECSNDVSCSHTDEKFDAQSSDGGEMEDEESDGEGQWITQQNIHCFGQHETVKKKMEVACLTTDFSIQNVLIQMGLNVLTIDGYRVKKIKLWSLVCRGCGWTTRDTTKLFCSKCGHQTVDRVPTTVDGETGEIRIEDNRRFKRLRGTIFSIPKTVGGRNNNDLILAEDQLFMGGRLREHRHQQSLWEKERMEKNPFNIDAAYEQLGWWNRRQLPSGKLAVKGAPKIKAGCRGNPNSNLFHKKGGFKK